MNSKSRGPISGKEAEAGYSWCEFCGARVKIRVHWASEGSYAEVTMSVHEEAPRKAPVVSQPNEASIPVDLDYEDMVMASIISGE